MDTAPEKFTDEDLLLAFEEPDSARNSYLPMCGVLMKLRSGLLRITRRSKLRKVFATQKKNNIKRSYHMIDDEVVNSDNSIVERDTNSNSNDNSDSNSNSNSCSVDNSFGSKTDKKDNSQLYDDADYSVENSKLLYYLFEKFVCNSEKELESWTPLTLWITSMELTMKGTNLSPDLFKEFLHQRLLPRDSNNRLTFNESFLYRVKQYHNTVKRPEGTFDVEEDELFSKLAGLDRQVCQQCQSRHQVYCGPCGGILLPNAREVIPNTNIVLPFKVKLLFHWLVAIVLSDCLNRKA